MSMKVTTMKSWLHTITRATDGHRLSTTAPESTASRGSSWQQRPHQPLHLSPPRLTATNHSKIQATRRSARFPFLAVGECTSPVCRKSWPTWVSHQERNTTRIRGSCRAVDVADLAANTTPTLRVCRQSRAEATGRAMAPAPVRDAAVTLTLHMRLTQAAQNKPTASSRKQSPALTEIKIKTRKRQLRRPSRTTRVSWPVRPRRQQRRRRNSPLPASPTRPTRCSGLNNPPSLPTQCRAHPWPTTRRVALSKPTLLLTRTPLHHLSSLSNNTNSLASPALVVPARSLLFKNAKDVSNKSTQTTTLAQPQPPCGSANSASTKTSGALVLKLSSVNTKSRTARNAKKQKKDDVYWKRQNRKTERGKRTMQRESLVQLRTTLTRTSAPTTDRRRKMLSLTMAMML
jgi:hypothetical protein